MEEFEKIKLDKKVEVGIEDLFLDPNNPRFSKHPEDRIPEDRIETKEEQDETFKRMMSRDSNFGIEELAESIKTRGFVPVDNIFVKKLSNGKFLVIEGNRRITAAKLLIDKNENGKPKDKLSEDIAKSLLKFECIDLTDKKQEEIDFILGLRHHGSLLQWGLLPASFNIYEKYMEALCDENDCEQNDPGKFVYDAGIAKQIKNLYSLKLSDVRDKLKTYRAYLQLKDMTVGCSFEEKFSIINDTVKSKILRKRFNFDEVTSTFEDEGAEELLDLICGKDGKPPVITAAASGEANLRDLAHVIDEGTEEDIRRIEEDRRQPSEVWADVKSKKNKRNLVDALDMALSELNKIEIGEVRILADSEIERIDKIQEALDKIRKIANAQ